MVLTDDYVQFCSAIGEKINVHSEKPFWTCPDGCEAHVPGEVYFDGYRRRIQQRIEEWILESIRSFEDFSNHFYTRRQTMAYLKRQSKIIKCEDERFNPEVIKNVIDWECFHTCICGQKFYLKKSVEKYCQTFDGHFPLSEGF